MQYSLFKKYISNKNHSAQVNALKDVKGKNGPSFIEVLDRETDVLNASKAAALTELGLR